ncbi:MAG TPA: GNAT family N-acetyltransferase [Thermoanaerobaculia bacterium]
MNTLITIPARVRHASTFTLPRLQQLWIEAVADSPLEADVDPHGVWAWSSMHDIDLDRSVVLESETGEFIGLSLFGVRGARGWIGAFGVAPRYRRVGYGAMLLDAQMLVARESGLGSVQVEVLIYNWAAKLFEQIGFTTSRVVVDLGGVINKRRASAAVTQRNPELLVGEIQSLRCGRTWPWRREMQTICRTLTRRSHGLTVDVDGRCSAALICELEGSDELRILDIAGRRDCVGTLLAAAGEMFPGRQVTLLAEPQDSELQPVLAEHGLSPFAIRRELVLHCDLPL